MRLTQIVGGVAILMIAGCASPRQQCIQAAQADLQALEQQIADLELALQRGYRQLRETAPRTTLHICAWPREPVLFCTRHTPGQSATRVAVDVAAERELLAQLQQKRVEEANLSARRSAACASR